jgi:hypothetical protein
VFGVMWLPAAAAGAANSPAFRDCSYLGGFDPDSVELTGATVAPNGALTVTTSQDSVTVVASESSALGDNLNHDTLSVTVSGTGAGAQTVSGTGVGQVALSVPLSGVAPGGQYTIDWSATFNNGFHACPGQADPQNTSSNPFVLRVVGRPAPAAPVVSNLRESHASWREGTGTTFSFDLNERASVTLIFRRRGSVPVGAIVKTGEAGPNALRFRGRVHAFGRLPPGRYVLVVTATNAAGERSSPASIAFVLRPRFARRA